MIYKEFDKFRKIFIELKILILSDLYKFKIFDLKFIFE